MQVTSYKLQVTGKYKIQVQNLQQLVCVLGILPAVVKNEIEYLEPEACYRLQGTGYREIQIQVQNLPRLVCVIGTLPVVVKHEIEYLELAT